MSRTSGEHRVCPWDEIPERGGVLAVIDDVEVGVFRVHGRVHAWENRCRHQGGPVCTGLVIGRLEAVVAPDGTVERERLSDEEIHVVCPWHGWEYNLETGALAADPRIRLRRVPAFVRDGYAYVSV